MKGNLNERHVQDPLKLLRKLCMSKVEGKSRRETAKLEEPDPRWGLLVQSKKLLRMLTFIVVDAE